MSNVFQEVLELDQGVGHAGRVFGYDHQRHNFVNWGVEKDNLYVHSVEHDETEEQHGSLAETRQLAEQFLQSGERSAYATLLRSCKRGFERP